MIIEILLALLYTYSYDYIPLCMYYGFPARVSGNTVPECGQIFIGVNRNNYETLNV